MRPLSTAGPLQAAVRQDEAQEQARRIQEETDDLQKKLAERKMMREKQDQERHAKLEAERLTAESEANDMLASMRAKQAKLRAETKKMHEELNALHMDFTPKSGGGDKKSPSSAEMLAKHREALAKYRTVRQTGPTIDPAQGPKTPRDGEINLDIKGLAAGGATKGEEVRQSLVADVRSAMLPPRLSPSWLSPRLRQ